MKHLKDILLEVKKDKKEEPAANVAPPKEEKKETPKTSMFKYKVNIEKENGVMIYDKILNICQILQYDKYDEIEEYFEMNSGQMAYLSEMNRGETHEDTNSILTKIW